MTTTPRPFLTAHWRYLAMLNYLVEPAILQPFVPPGVELDTWNGQTFASMVGFLFLDTRLRGLAIPFHRNFEEVNLRFYVRRKDATGWKRGVVFVKEIVPRLAIAAVARGIYGEKYVALPMHHRVDREGAGLKPGGVIEYAWRFAGRWQRLGVCITGEASLAQPGSEEEFITEHYWGYTTLRSGGCGEYQVEHPPWRIWQTSHAYFECDVSTLYGPQFQAALSGQPSSAFLAEGSPVAVYPGRRLPSLP